MKVMIVDDSAVMRKIVMKALMEAGHTDLVEAADGKEALSKAGDVDVVFTDWNMPVMMGIDMLRAIRADPDLKHIPVLMVTAEAQKENIIEAVQAGVSNYVVKPFTSDALLEKLQKIFAKKTVKA